jgi:hypothetical protein
VNEFQGWVASRLDDNQRLITVADAEDQTGMALTQARRFLGVAALTAVILAAVAVLLSAMRFSLAQRDLVALLKAFGATGNRGHGSPGADAAVAGADQRGDRRRRGPGRPGTDRPDPGRRSGRKPATHGSSHWPAPACLPCCWPAALPCRRY